MKSATSTVDEIRRLTRAKQNIDRDLATALRTLKADSVSVSHCALQIRLAFIGRIAELNEDPGCCGVPTLDIHLLQCAQPDSWVHSSFDKWVQRGLTEDFKTKSNQ